MCCNVGMLSTDEPYELTHFRQQSTPLSYFYWLVTKHTRSYLQSDQTHRDMHFASWRLITCWVSSYVSPSGSSIASPWPSMASCPYSSGCSHREREREDLQYQKQQPTFVATLPNSIRLALLILLYFPYCQQSSRKTHPQFVHLCCHCKKKKNTHLWWYLALL